jgi:hypothetical protein
MLLYFSEQMLRLEENHTAMTLIEIVIIWSVYN